MKKNKKNDDEELRQILAEIHNKPEKIPAGFFTVPQWVERWGKSYNQTLRILALGMRAKIFERREFRVLIASGYARKTAHFKHLRKSTLAK